MEIRFSKLAVLHLNRSKIESIEGINWIHMPILKCLGLRKAVKNVGKNLITKVTILKKSCHLNPLNVHLCKKTII